ncbi:TPA: ATP-binding protein [Salmonella enterica]
MKNIADSGILARIRKLAPQSAERAAPFRTPEEWREWQLAEGRRSCEEIDRQNRQARAEKIFGRAGIQRLHRGCSFANYRIQNDGQRHALSQAKSIAGELDTGCTNFVFSGNPGTGKNHLAAAIGNRLMNAGRSVIVITVADVMSALHASYDDGKSGEKFLRELCGVDLLILDEVDCATAAICQECHHEIDNGSHLSREERRCLMNRAIVLTVIKLVRMGKVVPK